MGCGFLPESARRPGLRPFPEATVCPGYSTRLPEVYEAARALHWAKRGGLGPVYGQGQLPQAALDAIDILDGAANELERETYRKQREEMKRRGS